MEITRALPYIWLCWRHLIIWRQKFTNFKIFPRPDFPICFWLTTEHIFREHVCLFPAKKSHKLTLWTLWKRRCYMPSNWMPNECTLLKMGSPHHLIWQENIGQIRAAPRHMFCQHHNIIPTITLHRKSKRRLKIKALSSPSSWARRVKNWAYNFSH